MSPGYAKVPNSWSHILFLTVVYVCSCNKCLLNIQFFLYTTVVVLMTLFLIFWYNPSEKLHPLVGWITKQTCKRDCLSSVLWISEHGAMVTSFKVRTGVHTSQRAPYRLLRLWSPQLLTKVPNGRMTYSPYYSSSTTPLSKDSQMVFSLMKQKPNILEL